MYEMEQPNAHCRHLAQAISSYRFELRLGVWSALPLRAHAIGGRAESVSQTAECGSRQNNKESVLYVVDYFAFAVVIAVSHVCSIGIECGL